MTHEYEAELTAPRDDVATVLRSVADGVAAGSVRLGGGDGSIVVDLPEEVALEVEFEAEDDDWSLELELEFPRSETDVDESAGAAAGEPPAGDAELPLPVGAVGVSEPPARFEVFRDRRDEWRWRLRHHNGNVIATCGEGYTRKHNAVKGLRSVMRNAPEAAVTEDTEQ